jgi:hypothetical protein
MGKFRHTSILNDGLAAASLPAVTHAAAPPKETSVRHPPYRDVFTTSYPQRRLCRIQCPRLASRSVNKTPSLGLFIYGRCSNVHHTTRLMVISLLEAFFSGMMELRGKSKISHGTAVLSLLPLGGALKSPQRLVIE